LAQLAMDVYNGSDVIELRDLPASQGGFNKLWNKIASFPLQDADPKTGFYAAYYLNTATRNTVMAIRGTDSIIDGIVDMFYADNSDTFSLLGLKPSGLIDRAVLESVNLFIRSKLDPVFQQVRQAKSFFSYISKDNYWKKAPRTYICGHSLGGIVAKIIAPQLKCDTIAFNSPGVGEYLDHQNLSRCTAGINVRTYLAEGDPIGNLRRDNDVGDHKFVQVKDGQHILEEHDRMADREYFKAVARARLLNYHPIKYMYHTLKRDCPNVRF